MDSDAVEESYKLLDDGTLDEEQRIDALEALVRTKLGKPDSDDEVERTVLDILIAHRNGEKLQVVSKAKVVGSRDSKPVSAAVRPNKPKKKTWVSLDQLTLDETPDKTPEPVSAYDILRKGLVYDVSDQELERILAHNQFDIGKTLDMLVHTTRNTDDAAVQADEPAKAVAGLTDEQFTLLTRDQTASRVVCKYFLAGGKCFRGSDCMYSHDMARRVCRFWLQGRCMAGETCAFLHTVPEDVLDKLKNIQTPKEKAPPVIMKAALPKLGSKMGPKQGKQGPGLSTPPAWLAKPASSNTRSAPNPLAETLKAVEQARPVLSKPVLTRGKVQLRAPLQLPWEKPEFGHYAEYIELRESARKTSDLRNKYLQLATDTWASNDPKTARAFSNKGQVFNERMIESYRKAAAVLWDDRTLPSSDIYVDLLGLELGKAIDHLEGSLEFVETSEAHSPRAVYVICGRGHYKVKTYVDHLTQQVKRFLDERGYMHKDITDHAQYGRVIAVDAWSALNE